MSLYTKYRPKDFDNLVWQEFIKETLKKAITEEKTVWAYLFCWPRWTWKTSTARLFAKTINCLNLKDGNPCLECEICKEFAEDSLIDIIEIDAASHTWVDNIREIIEKAQFSPTKTKYKVYIIDEVHMLSKWAFNALLKILEEPPKHVKFILATTETHKVPETIISRCQRYDFKRIDKQNLKNRLLFIAKSENIEIDEKSLEYIISSSNWWLRNAISLFEQLIEDKKIIFSRVIEKLGISNLEEIENFISKLENKDKTIISDFDNIISSGKNLKLFFKEVIFKTKNKILDKIKNDENIFNLINIFDILDETYAKTKNSLDENTTFLVWILKIVGDTTNNNQNSFKLEETKKEEFNFKKQENNFWNNNSQEKSVKELEINQLQNQEEENFDLNDLNDIFWEDDPFQNFWNISETREENKNNEINIENNNSNEEKINFNWENFISKTKENWAKWALTMSLRACKFSLNNTTLQISPNTKIARTNVEKSDNIAIMQKTLSNLWFENYKITII